MSVVQQDRHLSFLFGSTKFDVSISWNGRRLDIGFDVRPPEDKVFFHRKKSKPYKPFIGNYSVKNTIDFYVSLRAILLRDYSYSYSEFNNKGVKGSKTFRLLLSSPSVKSAYGVLRDFLSSLNGDKSRFINVLRLFWNELLSHEDEEDQYRFFLQNYKKYMLDANFSQFSAFLEDAYTNFKSYSPEQFTLKEVFSAFYPYQQVIFEFMHTAEEARYTLLYLDYYIIDFLKDEIEKFLEQIDSRKSSIYGKSNVDKAPVPVLVIEKEKGIREFSLFPVGVSGFLDENEYRLFKKALDYYISTGIAPRFVSKNGIGLMGGKNSLVLLVGGKPFDILGRKEAARVLFSAL